MKDLIEKLVTFIEICGVSVILLGMIMALINSLKKHVGGLPEGFEIFKKTLGRAILLGLEFLVAADIINTVAVEPTLDNVTLLGLIVLIRTFLSFSMDVELEGKWPWNRDSSQKK